MPRWRAAATPRKGSTRPLLIKMNNGRLMPESLLRGCNEGPKSRLAKMDSGRKNRRGASRVRDGQHGPGSAPPRPRVVSGRRSTAIDHGAWFWRMLTWVSLSDQFRATVLITAYPDGGVRERALAAGVIGYLSKPFDENDLLACIRSALTNARSGGR